MGSMLPGASKEEANKIFDLFVSKGGNFIDTANVYKNGTNEKYVGEFVSSDKGHGSLPIFGAGDAEIVCQIVGLAVLLVNTRFVRAC